jgi:uncharacterized membrane protein YphA (DoxX/SURF4 family)
MEILLWIVQIALAAVFAAAGLAKLTKTREELAPRMTWVTHSSDAFVKTVGALELMASVGLVLPAALGVVPQLTALAAAGVVLLMLGAIKTNRDHHELERVPLNLVIAALALVVAIGRFGPYAF